MTEEVGTEDLDFGIEPEAGEQTASVGPPADVKAKRTQSTIVFPYDDLKNAAEVARVTHDAGGKLTFDQLAARLSQTATSGAFRLKVSAARIFGLVTTAKGTITVTDLGSQIADERTSEAAKAQAFLNAPLYRALHDRFKGLALPGDKGIETAMVDLGVAPKQATTARQVFQRSADVAGFFAHGRDRLVTPVVTHTGGRDVTLDGDGAGEDRGGDLTPPQKVTNMRSITLQLGTTGSAVVTLTLTGDLFSMTKDDRDFVLKLVDDMALHEARQAQPASNVRPTPQASPPSPEVRRPATSSGEAVDDQEPF